MDFFVRNKAYTVIFSTVVLLFLLFAYLNRNEALFRNEKIDDYPKANIVIKNQTLFAYIADTNDRRSLGLGVFDVLPKDHAMFFPYDTPGIYSFWMKGMKFPIDIFWIDENFRIVHIEEKVYPETYPKTFFSKNLAKYVLETNSGFREKLGITVGEMVVFNRVF